MWRSFVRNLPRVGVGWVVSEVPCAAWPLFTYLAYTVPRLWRSCVHDSGHPAQDANYHSGGSAQGGHHDSVQGVDDWAVRFSRKTVRIRLPPGGIKKCVTVRPRTAPHTPIRPRPAPRSADATQTDRWLRPDDVQSTPDHSREAHHRRPGRPPGFHRDPTEAPK